LNSLRQKLIPLLLGALIGASIVSAFWAYPATYYTCLWTASTRVSEKGVDLAESVCDQRFGK
jgi:hypothetical protein